MKKPLINDEAKEPFTWQKLKEFCNQLSDEQLQQTVRVIQEDSVMTILEAAELGEDKYLFDNEDDYSIGESDFDKAYHFDGKYNSLAEAIANEPHSKAPATNVYLHEDF